MTKLLKLMSGAVTTTLLLVVHFHAVGSESDLSWSSGNVGIQAEGNALRLQLTYQGVTKLNATLGVTLPAAVSFATICGGGIGIQCYEWGDYAKVTISDGSTNNDCVRIEWESNFAQRLDDCFEISPNSHWYGGGETYRQYWPIQQEKRPEAPYVTGDYHQFKDHGYGGVTENYWLISNGAAVNVDEDVPLFLSLNTTRANQICYIAKDEDPFKERDTLELKYSVCLGNNLKEVHQRAMNKFYSKPTGTPDEDMMIRPFWSTWAQYKENVNQSIVLSFADRIFAEGFHLSSHVEIDDHWETCYGEAVFNPIKFPDPKAMVDQLKAMGLRVTLWIHPFINIECPSFITAVEQGYLVKDEKGKAGMTYWWQGTHAGIIDFTNPDAVAWWTNRLRTLQTLHGIDSFKFDAGETNWLPYSIRLTGEVDLEPNIYSTKYVEVMSTFGGLIEVRVARRNQDQAIFSRMLDKDSRWGYDNGLKSLIPTCLLFGILGYPFVLPDMIGGNAYGERPSKELYIRWMQVNAFMPSVQFSIVPWDFDDDEVVQITQGILNLRQQHRNDILQAADQAVQDGSPINRPLWWVDPSDEVTYAIDDQYMLGESILVAPVVTEGATFRDIYLPSGTWDDGLVQRVGPTWVRDYPAPIEYLPYFIKSDTDHGNRS